MKKQHQWGFMASGGSNGKGELAQCQVKTCRMWSYIGGKPFKMSDEKYRALHEAGEIDASEVLGKIK